MTLLTRQDIELREVINFSLRGKVGGGGEIAHSAKPRIDNLKGSLEYSLSCPRSTSVKM